MITGVKVSRHCYMNKRTGIYDKLSRHKTKQRSIALDLIRTTLDPKSPVSKTLSKVQHKTSRNGKSKAKKKHVQQCPQEVQVMIDPFSTATLPQK